MTHHPAALRSFRAMNQTTKIMNVTPKQNPLAMRPTTSEPCSAATRSLPRLLNSATNPKKHGINAVVGTNLFILPPSAEKRRMHPQYCASGAAFVSPRQEIRP
jgi:hypothetical protein